MLVATAFFTAFLASLVGATSFLQSISAFPQLSNFTNLYQNNPFLTSLLTPNSTTPRYTVLVPNNDAFTRYQSDYGYAVTGLSSADLQTLISYHVLVVGLNNDNFTRPKGLAVPTLLIGQMYNNRTPGSALENDFGNNADGQIVYISPTSSSGTATVQSGLGMNATLSAIDGTWDGGLIQEIDEFLTLPQNCQDTITEYGLTSLVTAINRTDLWDDLDNSANYTCLSPTDQAFKSAGNPQVTLNESSLDNIMELHVIPQPLYTSYLQDGQEYQTDNNQTVRVRIENGTIMFNDATVLESNIITNNGVVHVLDRVMSEANASSPTTTSSMAPTSQASPSVTKSASCARSVSKHQHIIASGILGYVLQCIVFG